MIELKEIQSTNKHYTFIEELMTTSFPEQERRNKEDQRTCTDFNSHFHCNIIKTNGIPIGLITYWDFDNFTYIEHFAIHPSVRNKGYGKQVLAIIKAQNQKPIVLEAEEPINELSIRRIAFYQRQGFILHNQPYLQPPYREGDKWFPLKLMSYGNIDMERMFNTIKEQIYREVYNV